MAVKKIPVRKCLGCMEGRPKKELVRVVRSAEGQVSVDLTGKKSGRGAYLCPKKECLEKARRARRLERALECPLSEEVYAALEKEMEAEAPDENG